jgi:hypothetical protein
VPYPLALSFGTGGEIRRLLLIGQLLTLYTMHTVPVIYLYLDRLGQWSLRTRQWLLPPTRF